MTTKHLSDMMPCYATENGAPVFFS